MPKLIAGSASEQRLLELHKWHFGIYAQIARKLGVSPTYVSLVANGMRRSDKITQVLIAEIKRNHASILSASRGV